MNVYCSSVYKGDTIHDVKDWACHLPPNCFKIDVSYLNEVVALCSDMHEVGDEAELALALHLTEHRVQHDVDAGAADARAAMDDYRAVRIPVHRR